MDERKAALVCCSNALHPDRKAQVDVLRDVLQELGIETVSGEYLYGNRPWDHGTPEMRAQELMGFYLDKGITEIYDISGGELANTLLPHLDFETIAANPKPFWGYSDLTVLLNAIYARTGREGVLFQVRNLIADGSGIQQERFPTEELFCLYPHFLRGSSMEGILVGGNIRCFLKLAGTPYFPDLTGKILLLEAYGGEAAQMMTYLAQLRQLGAFDKVSGVLLGTFTKLERADMQPPMEQLVLEVVPKHIPVAKVPDVGHGTDSRAVRIGGRYRFTGKIHEKM